MAKVQKVTGRMAAVAAIKAAGRALTAGEIAEAVIASGVVKGLKGATPKATISAMVTSGAKNGRVFRRVGDGRPAKFNVQRGVEADEKLVGKLREFAA